MDRSFELRVFDRSDGVVQVCVAMLDDGPRTYLRSYLCLEDDVELAQAIAKAIDALLAYWRHGALYAEPLGSSWR